MQKPTGLGRGGLLGICFLREAPQRVIGADRRAGKWGWLGKTNELGFNAVEDKVHVHDLNATTLHLLDFYHTQLTYRAQGRDYRLTDVHGHVVKKVLA